MAKKEFLVEIPLNAKISVIVEAENEKEAMEEALSKCDLKLNPTSELGYNVEEWDIYEKMIEGNFWYGIIHEASAQRDY